MMKSWLAYHQQWPVCRAEAAINGHWWWDKLYFIATLIVKLRQHYKTKALSLVSVQCRTGAIITVIDDGTRSQIKHKILSSLSSFSSTSSTQSLTLSPLSPLSSTRNLEALRAPTSSWRPFGPLDFVLRALQALRPCDPRIVVWIAS